MGLRTNDFGERLHLGADYADWLSELEEIGAQPGGIELSRVSEELLARLGIDELDRADILAAVAEYLHSPEWTWLLERACRLIQHDVGNPEAMRTLPALPAALGAHGRCFWIVAFVAATEDIRNWHRSQAVSDDISWDTLADLGRHVRLYRQRNGVTGLDTHWWIALHYRGGIFAIGRLQFAPYHLKTGPAGPLFWYDANAAASLGAGFQQGDPAIGVHIPDSGPLTAGACAASFAGAHAFFSNHFVEYQGAVATCTSWLMDDQLLEYLEPTSNIVLFQRRFTLVPGAMDSDSSALHFVFGRGLDAIDQLEPRSTLEKAIIQHIKQGGHWRLRTGWLRLADQTG